jgi:nitroreductase
MSMENIKKIKGYPFVEINTMETSESEMIERSKKFYADMDKRRSVRAFSDKPVPKEVIDNIIKTASSAPSGAHKQPWFFCLVENQEIKKRIRIAAEKVEHASYHGGMPEEWLDAIKPLQTNWQKPFLEEAPYLIVVFKKSYDLGGTKNKVNYYVNESVGLACGFLLAAIHQTGLAALTHTPNPMDFLAKILGRPKNEKPYLLIPVGYPKENTWVPLIKRKGSAEIYQYY